MPAPLVGHDFLIRHSESLPRGYSRDESFDRPADRAAEPPPRQRNESWMTTDSSVLPSATTVPARLTRTLAPPGRRPRPDGPRTTSRQGPVLRRDRIKDSDHQDTGTIILELHRNIHYQSPSIAFRGWETGLLGDNAPRITRTEQAALLQALVLCEEANFAWLSSLLRGAVGPMNSNSALHGRAPVRTSSRSSSRSN